MSKLILVRHGQSEWNLKNRFTGWVDINLTKKGKKEAKESGYYIKKLDLNFNTAFSSIQKRAVNTLKIILKVINKKNINVVKSWKLNEKHYGALTGLDKNEIKKKYGIKQVKKWRRSWNVAPPALGKKNIHHPINIKIYRNLKSNLIPNTESLKDTYNRVIPFWKKNILTRILNNKNIIIVAHGNSLRALCKNIFKISNKNITKLEIPTGNPLLIEFSRNLKVKKCMYLNKSRAKKINFNKKKV